MAPDEIAAPPKRDPLKIILPFSGLPNGEWKIRMEVLVWALVIIHAAELMRVVG